MKQKMRIVYVLESTGLCGGVKVVLHHVLSLQKLGHDVTVISREPYPTWFHATVPFLQINSYDCDILRSCDWIVATFPLNILELYSFHELRKKMVHLVQGYENDYIEAKAYRRLIQEAYSLPIPKITISKRLSLYLADKYPDAFFVVVGQGIDPDCFFLNTDDKYSHANEIDRIFLIGPLSISIKQIPIGLLAYKRIREKYPGIQLVRISAVDTRGEEEAMIGPIPWYYIHQSPKSVGDILRQGNGILISPSSPGEGFGLPPIEAMACGVPTVLSDIPSFRSFAKPCDYALFAPHDNPVAMADKVCYLIENSDERRRLIKRGIEVASTYSFETVAKKIESFFQVYQP